MQPSVGLPGMTSTGSCSQSAQSSHGEKVHTLEEVRFQASERAAQSREGPQAVRLPGQTWGVSLDGGRCRDGGGGGGAGTGALLTPQASPLITLNPLEPTAKEPRAQPCPYMLAQRTQI